MTFWGICLRAELETHPDHWPIAEDFSSETSALSATSVGQRVKRTESADDYIGVKRSPLRDYWIDGNGKEKGWVYRFDPVPALSVLAPASKPKKASTAKAKKKATAKKKPAKAGKKKGGK